MRPQLSYTLWFTQRVGSTALCEALYKTRLAGNPGEWLEHSTETDALDHYGVTTADALRSAVWMKGMTDDSKVFGLKFGMWQPKFDQLLEVFRQLPEATPGDSPLTLWEAMFPASRHIILTRRDKVRLAVSWWMAVQTGEWHRQTSQGAATTDSEKNVDVSAELNEPEYSFEAINKLYQEACERESQIRQVLNQASETLEIVYEDFAVDPALQVNRILTFLDLKGNVTVAPLDHQKLAGELSERWVQRFNAERGRKALPS